MARVEDLDLDGHPDLIVQFEVSNTWISPASGLATLEGKLKDNTQLAGTDTICEVP